MQQEQRWKLPDFITFQDDRRYIPHDKDLNGTVEN